MKHLEPASFALYCSTGQLTTTFTKSIMIQQISKQMNSIHACVLCKVCMYIDQDWWRKVINIISTHIYLVSVTSGYFNSKFTFYTDKRDQ